MRDFNAHNTLWGSRVTDTTGKEVEEYITDKDLICINNGNGTGYNSTQNTGSAIDITLVSKEIEHQHMGCIESQTTIL